MPKMKLAFALAMSTALAAVLAAAAAQPAEAQRKSIRWATAQVGTYGYTVAASMAKILEQALGGETCTPTPLRPSP